MKKKVILGTAQIGMNYGINNCSGKPAYSIVKDIFDYALANEVKTLDTAEGYGESIEIISRFHKKQDEKFAIISKFKSEKYDERSFVKYILLSLEKLSVSYYETIMYHAFDDFVDERYKKTLHALKDECKIKKIGVSVYSNAELEAAINSDIDVIQLPFNILDNHSRKGELLQKAKSVGKEIHVRSVFLQGLFFKENIQFTKFSPLYTTLCYLKDVARHSECNIEDLALEYVFSKNYIDAIVFGVDSLNQIKRNISIVKRIDKTEVFEKIDSINIENQDLLNPALW